VKEIASDQTKHLLLLTATPHSGVEASFQSLLGLLRPDFLGFDLQEPTEAQRKELAKHIVQRRRGDIDERWLGGDGQNRPFPTRVPPFEDTYRLSQEYGSLFNDVLAFTRQTVQDEQPHILLRPITPPIETDTDAATVTFSPKTVDRCPSI